MRRLIAISFIAIVAITITACGGSSTSPDPENNESVRYAISVDITPSDAGAVSPSPEDTYEEGETAELTAEAADDYVFTGWTGDLGNSDNPLSLPVDRDYSLTANFEKKSYALTTNTNGEGVIAEELIQQKASDYEHGTVVELTAAPSGDWKFVEWSGDLTGTDNPAQITVDSPKEVTAVFEKRSYPLTMLIDGQGAVSETVIQQKTTDYEYGAVVELDPNASTGWAFTGWRGTLTDSQTPAQITVTQSTTIIAEFELLDEASRPAFYLAENGVTIKCEAASIGDTGTVDGEEYTKRSAADIDAANAATTCTSGITDMNNLFYGDDTFNGDVSHWDGSGNASFNRDISNWDVSNVTDMGSMFYSATSFNQDISSWDVSSVTNMSAMFQSADAFNQPIGNWNVSNVTDMGTMFTGASSFNQNLSTWDVSNVTDMGSMFQSASSFNGDISSWDVSSVTYMLRMFRNTSSFNQDLNSWDVSNVTNMKGVFWEASSFNGDLSNWDVSSVENMDVMFSSANSFNGNIGGWNVSSVTSMNNMFNDATDFNRDLSGWDVSSVTDMAWMFRDASSFNQDISSWCVSNFSSKPTDFDSGAGFDGDTSLQPQWGTCP